MAQRHQISTTFKDLQLASSSDPQIWRDNLTELKSSSGRTVAELKYSRQLFASNKAGRVQGKVCDRQVKREEMCG